MSLLKHTTVTSPDQMFDYGPSQIKLLGHLS